MRLFIADDSEVLRSRLVEILSEIEGIEIVGQEENAEKAVESINKLNPDVVILDIHLLGGSGISALETIKVKEKPPIVIMFTNYPYLQYRKRCMDAGADFFFYKSTEFGKLVDVVRDTARSSCQSV